MSNFTRLQRPLFILSLCLTIFTACKHASTNSTDPSQSEDKNPQVAASKQNDNRVSKLSAIRQARRRLPNDSAVKMGTTNDSFPLLRDKDSNAVIGFHFNAKDFADATGVKANSLFFRIGIKNFGDIAGIEAGTIKPEYTLIILPLDQNMRQITDAQGLVAFDFVCPCPGASCCPK